MQNYIIPIITGFVTLIASFFIAMYQSRLELRKITRQLEEKYTTSLFNKRMEVYPILSKLFVELNIAIESHNQNETLLLNLRKSFDNWLSSNGIYLTSVVAKPLWAYHYYLNDLFDTYNGQPLTEEKWIEIRQLQGTLNKFLRAELGIYDTQAAGSPKFDGAYNINTLAILEQSSLKRAARYKKLEEAMQKTGNVC